jgi:hypothetical protein
MTITTDIFELTETVWTKDSLSKLSDNDLLLLGSQHGMTSKERKYLFLNPHGESWWMVKEKVGLFIIMNKVNESEITFTQAYNPATKEMGTAMSAEVPYSLEDLGIKERYILNLLCNMQKTK